MSALCALSFHARVIFHNVQLRGVWIPEILGSLILPPMATEHGWMMNVTERGYGIWDWLNVTCRPGAAPFTPPPAAACPMPTAPGVNRAGQRA